ncbi:ribonuclease Y, partial [Patescibacteria group bacterium]|nr:ribonuclease Y [Patescibacteria group bacterium]
TEEAKNILIQNMVEQAKIDSVQAIKEIYDKAKHDAKKEAQKIIVQSIQRTAADHSIETTVSVVQIQNDEMKGRIIGKEGRNIRAFERATGVEIELDETNEIKLSSFDSIRREIARRALEKLIKDTRIQPSRIEEVVKQTKAHMEEVLLEEGKKIAEECGVYNLSAEFLKLIGRYKFRTSYGQNLAMHTIEETKIGIAIAKEIGAKVEVVRLGCLLHDIGKVVADEEGTHVDVGVSVLKKHGIPREVVNTVAEHHEDKPFSSVESVIVWIADAISGSRPGARYEPHEEYVKRMDKIEELAGGFDGVETVYAFQAGRDVRVIVKPEEIDDDKLTVLAHDIAKKLEKEAKYAGQIKVTAIREVRATDTTSAK